MGLETWLNVPGMWIDAHPFMASGISFVMGALTGIALFRSKKKK